MSRICVEFLALPRNEGIPQRAGLVKPLWHEGIENDRAPDKNGRYVFAGGFAGWVRCRLIHRCGLVSRRSAGVPRGRRLPPCLCSCR
jgi:hypothetical protein